jgi:hypothetical protein
MSSFGIRTLVRIRSNDLDDPNEAIGLRTNDPNERTEQTARVQLYYAVYSFTVKNRSSAKQLQNVFQIRFLWFDVFVNACAVCVLVC